MSLAKRFLPWAVSAFSAPPLRGVPHMMERAGAALQSKCGGATSSVKHEVVCAARFIGRQTPVLFDVGANIGGWTYEARARFPDASRIVMFEPQPSCWPQLERQLCPTIHLERLALSNQAHDDAVFWANENDEISSFYKRSDFGTAPHEIRVATATVDSFIEAAQLEFVDFMKMDVEGHEFDILSGARASIAARRIGALSFEFGQANVDSRTFFLDFWNLFAGEGWDIFRMMHNGRLLRLDGYSRDLEYFAGVGNYIAAPRS
jgi:FkbM family methyltransferase